MYIFIFVKIIFHYHLNTVLDFLYVEPSDMDPVNRGDI